MQTPRLTGTSVPPDFQYFRSISPVYRKYLEESNIRTIDVGIQFGWIKDFRLFQIVKFERTDLPPNKEFLKKSGFRRWLVLWIPAHTDNPGIGWRELLIPGGHFTSTGIGRPIEQYWVKWNERARRARNRFLTQEDVEIKMVDSKEFIDAFLKAKVKHHFKSDYIKYYQRMYNLDPTSVRSFLAVSKTQGPIAGLAVHDSYNMSTHLIAFTDKSAKMSQAGTGLINAWYADSFEKKMTYIHFDHLRDVHMTKDQQGYTDFKLNFIEQTISYPKCYFQFW